MLGRRFVLLVAVLLGVTAVAASLAPRQPAPRDQRAAQPTPEPAPAGAGPVQTLEEELSTRGKPRRIAVDRGALLELQVTGDELDSVSLEGEVEVITEDTNAIFNIYADTPGTYPIELVDANRIVGTLVVRE